MLKDYVGEAVRELRQCGLGCLREDALNRKVLNIVEIRRFGMFERPVAERELRALDVQILVKRWKSHPTVQSVTSDPPVTGQPPGQYHGSEQGHLAAAGVH